MHVSNLDLKELQYRMQQEDEEGYEERHVHPQDEESHWTPPAEGDDNFKVPGLWHVAAVHCTVLANKQRQPLDISMCTGEATAVADSLYTDEELSQRGVATSSPPEEHDADKLEHSLQDACCIRGNTAAQTRTAVARTVESANMSGAST
jgi:hypothetical protein